MVRYLTPEEIKIRADRIDLEERIAKNIELLELGAPAMESIEKMTENSDTLIEKVKELIELSRREEERHAEMMALLHRLLGKLRA